MTTGEVAEVLRGVYDPELAIDIVSLGLVYGIEAVDGEVAVTITTTSPDCPMSDALYGMTEAVLQYNFPLATVHLALTHSPQWTVEMAERAALEELGLVRR